MIEKILSIFLNDWFWIVIAALVVLGRNLLWKADIKFYPKKYNDLSVNEQKKIRVLRFWGRFLLFVSAPFLILFTFFLIYYLVNR